MRQLNDGRLEPVPSEVLAKSREEISTAIEELLDVGARIRPLFIGDRQTGWVRGVHLSERKALKRWVYNEIDFVRHAPHTVPYRKGFNPGKFAAHEAVEQSTEAFKGCRSYASSAAESEVRAAESQISSSRTAHAAAEIDSTLSALPTGAAGLPDD
jgi:hypothetical protein